MPRFEVGVKAGKAAFPRYRAAARSRVLDVRAGIGRRVASLGLAAIIAAGVWLFTGLVPAPAVSHGQSDCGTYSSDSSYSTAKVIAIRGVSCREARKVAKKYDHKGRGRGPWECFLAHGDGRALFSCGYGDSQGDVRDFPHALVAKGVGSPGG